MRIAYFCLGLLGGSSEVAVNLALQMKAQGHEVELFDYAGEFFQRLKEAGVLNHSNHRLDYSLFEHIKSDFSLLDFFHSRHSHKAFDLVHIHYAIPLLHILSNIRQLYGIPAVITFHGSDATIVPEFIQPDLITKLVTLSGGVLSAASLFLKKTLESTYQLNPNNIHIIPNSISEEFFTPFLPTEEGEYFLHCSNLRNVKRATDLVLALHHLKDHCDHYKNTPIPLLHIVGDGPDLSEIKLMAHRAGVCHLIRFHGRVDDRAEMVRIMQKAKALILCSMSESQPLVVLEAMALGVPVICSDFDSVYQLLGEKGERGCIFPVGDFVELAEKMAEVHFKAHEAKNRAQKAREYVLEHHKIEQVLKAYEELYLKLLS